MTVELAWRGQVANAELNASHAEGFEHVLFDDDWEGQLAHHSLGWVVARDEGRPSGSSTWRGTPVSMPFSWTRSSRCRTEVAV